MDSLLNLTQAQIQQLSKQIEDPVWFCENILGGSKPWDKQAQVMNAVKNHKRVAVRSGHGVGKTWTAARIAIWFLTAFRPSKVITTAPTWQQVEKLLWTEIATQYATSKYPLGGKLLQTEWKITADHFAIGYSTDDPTKFQGHHSPHILVIFDEAMGIQPFIWEAAEGLLTSGMTRFLAIGNPTIPIGNFYDAFKSPIWEKIKISCYDCPNVTSGELLYPGLVTKEWIDERKIEWGENSPIFKSRVAGDFPEEGNDTLIPLFWVERAQQTAISHSDQDKRVLGVDVARYGDDHTAFVVMEGKQVIHLEGYQGKNTTTTVGVINKLASDFNVSLIAVDDSGVGGGVVDMLQEQKKNVLPVNFGESAKDGERFENLKSEIFWSLREDFEQSQINIGAYHQLMAELPTILYEVTSKGRLKIVGKDKMKKLGLHSPDYADALVIAHYATYGTRNSILDFYKENQSHGQPDSLIKQLSTGTDLQTALQRLTQNS